MQLSCLRYTKFLSHLRRKKEKKIRKRSETKLLKIRLLLRNLSKKTEISSNPTKAVSLSDCDKEIVTAELVLSSLAQGDMGLHVRRIPEEENVDETLELLHELLDKSTELEPLMDLEEIDSQANTNDLKTIG